MSPACVIILLILIIPKDLVIKHGRLIGIEHNTKNFLSADDIGKRFDILPPRGAIADHQHNSVHMLSKNGGRITSYNVCYTKLLRWASETPLRRA